MIAEKLIELIEIHAGRLAADVAGDLATNERTRGFRAVPRPYPTSFTPTASPRCPYFSNPCPSRRPLRAQHIRARSICT